jgi:hypothetical protein
MEILQTIGNIARTAVGLPQKPTGYVPPGLPAGSIGGPQSQAGVDYPNYTPQPIAPANAVKGTSVDSLTPGTFTASSQSGGKLKYTVKNWTYPIKVSGAADLQHYVVFFINIRGKSKFKAGSKAAIGTNAYGRLDTKGLTKAGVSVAGGAVGGILGGAVLANVKPTTFKGKTVRAALLGADILFGAKAAQAVNSNSSTALFEPDQTFRIDQAIMLAVNEKPSVTYGVNYEGKELGTLIGWLAGGTSVADTLDGKGSQNLELLRATGMAAAKIPSGIADALGFNLDATDALSVATASTLNPFKEQVFRNVHTREFLFNYKFLPRSQTEFDNVQAIIKQFKVHMHPELSSGRLFYIYPSTFDVVYYYRGQVNKNVHRIATCALERMSVDYGGQGFNTFNNGGSTEIDLRLQFRELEVLTRERIEQGGY